MNKVPIGVFDSGYGGLTVLSELFKKLPHHDFIYFGDNARAPYGNRSFEIVYAYTLEAVDFLFSQGCELIILACNTASAKALRTIQQNDLPKYGKDKRILGVIRPCTEYVGHVTQTNSIGVLGTAGTVNSNSYPIELNKFFPGVAVYQHACPMWVPLIENNMHLSAPGKQIIKQDVEQFLKHYPAIDTIVLACTHYPILLEYIQNLVGEKVKVIAQGSIVADKLVDYLERHDALSKKLSKRGCVEYFTTENSDLFDLAAVDFLQLKIQSKHIVI